MPSLTLALSFAMVDAASLALALDVELCADACVDAIAAEATASPTRIVVPIRMILYLQAMLVARLFK